MLEKIKESLQYFNFALLISFVFMYAGKDNKIEVGKFDFELEKLDTKEGTFSIKVSQETEGEVPVLDTLIEVRAKEEVESESIDTAKTAIKDTI